MAEIEQKKREALEERLRTLAEDVKTALDEANPDDQARMVTDAVLVIGARSYNDQGQCIGTVYGFSLEGAMPGYVAKGLLQEAIEDMVVEEDR